MRINKYLLLVVGLLGCISFLLFRYSAEIGICPDLSTFQDGTKYCESTRGMGDYFWPLWDFSRAVLVVGVLAFFRSQTAKILFGWTLVSAIGIALAVIAAPEISSDFLVPIEKKTVGTLLSGLYLGVSVIIFCWMSWRSKKNILS